MQINSNNSDSSQQTDTKYSFVMIVLNGMPFIEYSLKSVYDFAHEIIIVEGAVEKCLFAASPDGSSKDGTIELIKSFPDPANKIKAIQGRWPEKCEMQNEALKHVTGDYVWLIDSDEVYKSRDLEEIDALLRKDRSITQVNFIFDNFWKGFDYIISSEQFFLLESHCRRVFKFVPGAIFTTHRPPTMVWPGSMQTTEQMHLVGGLQTRQMGIIPCHYSYVVHEQVRQKIELYRRYGWAKGWKIDLNEWYNGCFLKWTPENRKRIEANYGAWTGDKNSCTISFTGEHPEVMLDYIRKFRNGNIAGMQKERCWGEEQIRKVVGDPYYQKKVIEAWDFLETDEPVVKRRDMMLEYILNGLPFWNIHVALAFIAEKLNPRSYLEIGVRTGCSLVQVLHNSNVEYVVGVDIWDGNYAGFPNTMAYTTRQIEAYKSRTNKNFKVEFIAGNSHEKLKELIEAGRKFDLITVDGDHSEIGASEDLDDAVKLLDEQGAIVFDDIIHQSFPFLKDLVERFQRKYPCFQALTNSTQDNGCVIFLKNIDTTGLLGASPAVVSSGKAKNVKVAEDYVRTGMQVDTESSFAGAIEELFSQIRPKKIVETGTFLGTGTTTVIAGALRSLGLDSTFYTIEVNPAYCARAKEHLHSQNFNVTVLNGLSVPRSSLPTIEQIQKATVTNIEFDDTFVDHKADVRAEKYYEESNFRQVPDNLLYHCLKSFDFRPDFVLLDSAGHIGNIEFNHLVGFLQGPCYIALDDIYHIKHRKSFEQIQSDSRFKLITSSREKFGFCIAKFTPQLKPSRKEVKNILWVRTDSIGDGILSSSMLSHIQDRFPQAQITVVCQEHIANLYQACPFVKNIITIPAEHKWQSRQQYESVIEQIRQVRADMLLNSTWATHGLADIRELEFIPRRVALRNVRDVLYTDIIPTDTGFKPELDRHCDFLKGLGINVTTLKPKVWMTCDDQLFVEKIFKEFKLKKNRTIALFAGARTEHRLYEQYGKALRQICKEGGYTVVAMGSKKDYQINNRNLEAIGGGMNLSGTMTLRQTAAFMKHCCLAVGAETALAHIACAVETPNVILLGGGHFGRFMPYSPLTSIVSLPLDCFGCNWQCKYQRYHCVCEVLPEVIAKAVRQNLEKLSSKVRAFIQGRSLYHMRPGMPQWKPLDQLIDLKNIEAINIENLNQTPISQHAANVNTNKVEVSIVLCTKNRARLLDKMLASLAEAAKGICYEVIVTEGGSDDNTMAVLQKHGIANIYLESEHLGPGRHSWPELYNFGFSKASGKWAMYASDDIVFGKECVSRGVEFLNQQKNEVAGGIFFYQNCSAREDWDKFGIDFTFGSKLLMNYGLIRLDYFREVGGLDPAYKFYCADGDLCFKLYEMGKELIPLPGCIVIHNNILDAQKEINSKGTDRDIALYKQRWKHFVSLERSKPKRLLWHEDIADALTITKTVPRINIGLEYFWHGLACWQYRMFSEAKLKFLQALQSGCDHWQVLWYLARAASECGENQIVEKAAKGVLRFVPDFGPAKEMLHQLGGMTEYEKIGVGGQKNNRKNVNDTLSQIKAAGLWHPGQMLKLHLGCGKWKFDGYVNIDYPQDKHTTVTQLGADIHADITKLSFPPESVDEIRLHHVFEHFNRVTALGLLVKWHRWLRIGGRIHIETPDLVGSAKTLLSNASWKTKMGAVRHLAGDQAAKWAYHIEHWFPERFERTLKKLGFDSVQTQSTSWEKEPYLSNVEVVAVKNKFLSENQLLQACDELLNEVMVADTPNERKMLQIWKKELREFLQHEIICCEEETSKSIDQIKGTVGLIFSKDRAMQLAATIESFLLHCNDPDIIKLHVLYKTSDKLHHRQYEKLKDEFPDVSFIEEINFKQQTLDILNKSEHIFFMVDDNLFVRKFTLTETIDALNQNPDALGFSLRLGQNTHYSYARDIEVTLPGFEAFNADMLKFNWTDQQAHFGYPLELSSSVYRSAEIKPLIGQLSFTNPNMLEGAMDTNKHLYTKERFGLLCYKNSVTFCNPVNMVQTVCSNRSGSQLMYSSEELARKFEQGERIDVKQYAGFVPNSCHQEVELMLRKTKAILNSNAPLVSVEMVTYNAEKYLRGAIESILAQTYENFELVIVDDGSTDNTRQIVESFSDKRIRYFYKTHKNRWAGTNYAIAHAKGKYILAVDSDDSIAPDYIEKMIIFAEQLPEVDYFYPRVLTIIDKAGELTGSKWEYIDFSDNRILPNCLFEMLLSPIPYPGSLRRMSMFEKTGGYEELENVADFVFLCKNALKVNFKRVEEQSVYFYRCTGTSLSHRIKIRNQTMAKALNDMVLTYPPEMICPQIAAIKEPALKEQQYYKYLMDVFYKHVKGHMVQFGEYFKKYGDFYKSKLMECASKVNRATSAVFGPPAQESAADLFEQGIKHLKSSRPNDALTCFNKVIRAVGQMPDLHYARAVALLQLGRIYDAQMACHAELDRRKDHQGAKKLLDRISRSREACKIG